MEEGESRMITSSLDTVTILHCHGYPITIVVGRMKSPLCIRYLKYSGLLQKEEVNVLKWDLCQIGCNKYSKLFPLHNPPFNPDLVYAFHFKYKKRIGTSGLCCKHSFAVINFSFTTIPVKGLKGIKAIFPV
jgi:hypothetical protein